MRQDTWQNLLVYQTTHTTGLFLCPRLVGVANFATSTGKGAKMNNQANGRVLHVPAGEGRSMWVAGDTYTFKVIGEETSGGFAFWEAVVPPQAGPPPHVHKGEDEAYYVLEGELEILDGDRTITVRAGSFVYIPRGILHAFKNVGKIPSRMLLFVTPAGFENFFFEIGLPARAGEMAPPLGPEEMEKTLQIAPKYGMELHLPPDR
jgi:quercetin dioxygenase-like cupin family protein